MNYFRVTLLLSCLLFLSSCAGFALPDSSDPYKKLRYAGLAMEQGRWIPAERYIQKAIEIFRKRNDETGIANAYVVYGQYYKYGNWCKFEGDYCPKGSISRPKSIEYFKKAIALFKKHNDNFGQAQAYFGLASAYGGGGQFKESCETFDLSLAAYLRGKGKKDPFRINPNFRDFKEMLNAFREKVCSSI